MASFVIVFFFFFQAEDGIRDIGVTGVQTCALPISFVLPDEKLFQEDLHLVGLQFRGFVLVSADIGCTSTRGRLERLPTQALQARRRESPCSSWATATACRRAAVVRISGAAPPARSLPPHLATPPAQG